MNMKKIKLTVFLALMLAAMAFVQGCALLLLGGAAAGAAYGTVKYVNNTLDVTHEVSLDKAWTAANAALKELQMPVTASTKDGATGRLEALNAKNQPVVIQTIRKTDTVTEIQITVGTFESAANQTEAQQIYDHMKARF
jgi:conjugal transfer/entry exclusion protein